MRSVNASWDLLKLLADPTRLRLLALLLREELSVAELQDILGMAQSRISSQLALLRQSDLVSDRRDGKKAFYSLRSGLPAAQLNLLRAAWDAVSPELVEDQSNLDRVLARRRAVPGKPSDISLSGSPQPLMSQIWVRVKASFPSSSRGGSSRSGVSTIPLAWSRWAPSLRQRTD